LMGVWVGIFGEWGVRRPRREEIPRRRGRTMGDRRRLAGRFVLWNWIGECRRDAGELLWKSVL
jgi:hypothetical protein